MILIDTHSSGSCSPTFLPACTKCGTRSAVAGPITLHYTYHVLDIACSARGKKNHVGDMRCAEPEKDSAQEMQVWWCSYTNNNIRY